MFMIVQLDHRRLKKIQFLRKRAPKAKIEETETFLNQNIFLMIRGIIFYQSTSPSLECLSLLFIRFLSLV